MQCSAALCQGQAKTRSFLLPCWARVQLLELREKATQVFRSNPNAGVADRNLHPRSDLTPSDLNAPTIVSELDGFGEQVQHHLLHLHRLNDQLPFVPCFGMACYLTILTHTLIASPHFL